MIAIWVLLVLMALIGIMMAVRLDLAKMALRYLIRNPRQAAVAVVGLTVSTSAIVGSAVVTDSAAKSLQDELERIRGTTDVVVRYDRQLDNASRLDGVGDLDGVIAAGWLSETRIPVKAEGGLITAAGTVYGMGASYPAAVKWEALDGNADDHSLVLTESMATRLDADVGSNVDLIFPAPHVSEPQWSYYSESDSVDGVIRTATIGPDGEPAYAPGDFSQFSLSIPDTVTDFRMEVSITDNSNSAWSVQWLLPDGTSITNQTAAPTPDQSGQYRYARQHWAETDGFVPGGEYTVRFVSQAAAGATIYVSYAFLGINGIPPWTWEPLGPVVISRPVSAIIDDGADPAGSGQAVFIPHADMLELVPQSASVSIVAARVDENASPESVGRSIQKLSASTGGEVRDLRTEPEEEAEKIRQQMVEMWVFMAGFTVLSAVVLLFVLVALLADERRSTLATVRAIGGRRNVLMRIQLFEVFALALMAGVVGGIVGMIVAAILSGSVDTFWAVDKIVFSPATVAQGIAISVLLIMFFALFAAWRSSRLEIAPALRDMDAPARGSKIRDVVLAVLITAAGVFFFLQATPQDPISTTLGVPLIALGAGLFTSRWVPKSIIYPIVGATFIIWMVATFRVLAEVDSAADALMLPLRALLFATGGAMVFAYLRPLHTMVGAMFGRFPGAMHMEQAIAQWRTRPGRAALTVVMVSMLLMSILFMTSLISESEGNSAYSAGGFDVVAWSQEPLEDIDEWLEEHPPLADVDPFEGVADYVDIPWTPVPITNEWRGSFLSIRNTYAVTEEFVEAQAYTSIAGPPADEAFRQLLSDPGAMVIDGDMWNGNLTPQVGDTVVFTNHNTGNQTASVRIIAITDGNRLGSAYFHPDTFAALVEREEGRSSRNGTAIFSHVGEGVDPAQVAARMETAFLDSGTRAVFIEEAPSDVNSVRAILSVFIVLALAIGAVALGLIAARNVVRRRREIGMIRAIGGTRRQVVASITLETLLLVLVSVAIGWTGAAMLIQGIFDDDSLRVDWWQAIWLSMYTVVLGVIAAMTPAYMAARLDPAVAVRNQE